jgi:hypothetical protein
MAHVNKNPVPNMVGMRANAKEALIMKDMGNGHMRPYMWGMSVTLVSGETQALIASGTMGGVNADACVYTLCPVNNTTQCYVSKDAVEHTVKVTFISEVTTTTSVDIMVFMSTATTVDINDYTGQRGYLRGNF